MPLDVCIFPLVFSLEFVQILHCFLPSHLDSSKLIRAIRSSNLSDQFNVYRLCKTLDVLKSTYYHHALRSPEKTQIQLMDEQLRPRIADIFEKSRKTFGARRIRIKLREEGYITSEKRISRLMKEMGLNAAGSKPMVNSANDRIYKYYPNKLKGVFLTDSLNKVWVSDITYVKIDGAFVYLCVVIDLYSRKVIAHKVSKNIDTALVKNTFMSAFESRDCPEGVTFHSDQGTQYTSYAFRTLLRSKGVVLSYSRPGTPHDNAVAESFFASIKKEDFRRTFYPTKADVIKAVNEYVEFYNDYRPHQRLGYLVANFATYIVVFLFLFLQSVDIA
ncbi:MAG: IS3 family transposase [Anaerovoracaceae bacterium]